MLEAMAIVCDEFSDVGHSEHFSLSHANNGHHEELEYDVSNFNDEINFLDWISP